MGWWAAISLAQVSDDDLDEIVVEAHQLAEAKEALHRELKSRGYVRFLRLGQRSWYLNPKLWKPGVMIHAEGFARVRGRPVMPLAVRVAKNDLQTEIVETTFLTQSRRTRRQQKAELIQSLETHLRDVRDAHWAMARVRRGAELREELARLWFERTDARGTVLDEPSQIREALFQRWSATSTGEAGGEMRAIIDSFVVDVVQASNDPFTAEELAGIRARVPDDRDPPRWGRQDPMEESLSGDVLAIPAR